MLVVTFMPVFMYYVCKHAYVKEHKHKHIHHYYCTLNENNSFSCVTSVSDYDIPVTEIHADFLSECVSVCISE
jgi:hypothetical protein